MGTNEVPLTEMFARNGRRVDAAVPAWTGANPTWTKDTNLAYFFNKPRAIARIGQKIEVWTTWSGPPSKLLYETDTADVKFVRHQEPFERLRLGRRTLWVDSRDREKLSRGSRHPRNVRIQAAKCAAQSSAAHSAARDATTQRTPRRGMQLRSVRPTRTLLPQTGGAHAAKQHGFRPRQKRPTVEMSLGQQT